MVRSPADESALLLELRALTERGRHRDVLVRYVRAYLRGLRWAFEPGNLPAVTEAVGKALRVPPAIAERSIPVAFAEGGLVSDAVFDEPGLRGVLAIRAEICGQWDGSPPPPEAYMDPSPYREALASLSLR